MKYCCGTQEQQTALHIAARLGAVDCALLLLDNGAAADATTVELYTPLHIAAKEGHDDVVQLLLDRGADSNLATSVSLVCVIIRAGFGRLQRPNRACLLVVYFSRQTSQLSVYQSCDYHTKTYRIRHVSCSKFSLMLS